MSMLRCVHVANYDAGNSCFSVSGPPPAAELWFAGTGGWEVGDHLQLVCWGGAGLLVSVLKNFFRALIKKVEFLCYII